MFAYIAKPEPRIGDVQQRVRRVAESNCTSQNITFLIESGDKRLLVKENCTTKVTTSYELANLG